MALPLPDLDDRRWVDLVEEARSLLPVYAPAWTDHNVHDPGMTLIDLLAWVTEADVYAINRIRDSHRRRFLALVGVRPADPRAARIPVLFAHVVADGGPDHVFRLPRGTEVETTGRNPNLQLRIVADVDVQPGRIVAVLVSHRSGVVDRTVRWEQGESVPLFGSAPREGDALLLGFDRPIVPGSAVRLYVRLDPDGHGRIRSDDEEGRRIAVEAAAGACPPNEHRCDGPTGEPPPAAPGTGSQSVDPGSGAPAHHSVRVVWEYRDPGGVWRPAARVDDETRAFTLDGHVVVHLPPAPAMGPAVAGLGDTALFHLRCRLAHGCYDAPPTGRVLPNTVVAVQAVPVASVWEVPTGIAAPGALEPGQAVHLDLRFEPHPRLLAPSATARLAALAEAPHPGGEQPRLRVLRFDPASGGRPGRLHVEAEWLGHAAGVPYERFELARTLPLPATIRLFTIDHGVWRAWQRRDDHLGSRRNDRHFILDPAGGTIVLGDGERGRVAPAGADVVATYDLTTADAGNLAPSDVRVLADSLHNRALIADLADVRLALTVTNPLPGRDGTAEEALERALGRGFVAREVRTRAITLKDCEALALETPGTRIARAAARADVHPRFPCYTAPGVVTVVVAPWLPADRPQPSAELLQLAQGYLDRRTLLGTRIVVTGPTYRALAVQARARVLPGADPNAVQAQAVAALDRFFDPLHGGPDGTGWPLGRGVYRSEVLQVLDETPGVDHVSSLEMLMDDGEPSCGNACLAPTELVAAGGHRIEVTR